MHLEFYELYDIMMTLQTRVCYICFIRIKIQCTLTGPHSCLYYNGLAFHMAIFLVLSCEQDHTYGSMLAYSFILIIYVGLFNLAFLLYESRSLEFLLEI